MHEVNLRKRAFHVLCVASLAVGTACAEQPDPAPVAEGEVTEAEVTETEAPAETSPEDVVQAFYDGYIETGASLADDAYRESPHLTEGFVQRVNALFEGDEVIDADPFLCAQDVPESFTTGEADVTGDAAIVPVETSFEEHGFSVHLTRSGGTWQIDDVECRTS